MKITNRNNKKSENKESGKSQDILTNQTIS
jgi:hypothetical protein